MPLLTHNPGYGLICHPEEPKATKDLRSISSAVIARNFREFAAFSLVPDLDAVRY